MNRTLLRPLGARAATAGVATLAVGALLTATAGPALAGTTTTTSTGGTTSAAAIRLTLNLPDALAATPLGNQVQLEIDPVAGTVRALPGSSPQAQALAAVIAGNIGSNAQSFGAAEAKLPSPTSASGSPLQAISDGIAASPLSDFLAVDLASSTASVTTAPKSTSQAGTRLGLGLPTALAPVLTQVLDPLLSALDEIIDALGPLDAATQALCDGLAPVTGPLAGGVAGVPVLGGVLESVVDGVTNPQAGVLCTIRKNLAALKTSLGASLADLTGVGGLITTGLLETSQTITTAGAKVTAKATSQVDGFEILGQNPFGTGRVLKTTSTATVDKGTADATVDEQAVQAVAAPLLDISTDLDAITGNVDGIDITPLQDVLDEVQALLDALAGIGLEAGPLGSASDKLGSCPATLTSTLSGTYEKPGVCAAAAARGYGLAVTLPAELAGPLGITGPLLQLAFAPSAAVARTASSTVDTGTPETPGQLPRTGASTPVAAAGVLLLLGAAFVRRRRTAGI